MPCRHCANTQVTTLLIGNSLLPVFKLLFRNWRHAAGHGLRYYHYNMHFQCTFNFRHKDIQSLRINLHISKKIHGN